ncbi:hypothetical protein [uncultured Paracoccus sp.]|uniref:hypothetical protein n=1 Tax=uncultured Paracoccus sp. TaxID=189685 RepID=UPI0026325C69|nr:hypothetical protein [uncultured Paracoccus sp.]
MANAAMLLFLAAWPASTAAEGAGSLVTDAAQPPGRLAQAPLSANDWLTGKAPPPNTTSGWRPGDGVPPDAARRRAPASDGQPGTGSAPQAPLPAADGGQQPTGAIPPRPGASQQPGVAGSATPPPVTVTRLGQGNPDAAGVQSAQAAGLSPGLWQGMTADAVADALARTDMRLPALRKMLRRILTAQLEVPPPRNLPQGGLLLARVDRLIDQGDLPAARALLQAAGPGNPQLFRRSFDLDLLTGEDAQACAALSQRPGLVQDMATRIYCLALNGDWAAAAVALHGAQPLGLVDPRTAALLARFLDDAYAEQSEDLPPPPKPSPLVFRLYESVGQPLPTPSLPLIYAWADLGENGGWKPRLEAAERLARAGLLPARQLHEIYSEQRPAASGGVWDRAAALQAVIAALDAGDQTTLDTVLPAALSRFAAAGLAPELAGMIADRLPAKPPAGGAAAPTVTLRLLAGLPVQPPAGTPSFPRWLAGFAAGSPPMPLPDNDPGGRAAALAPAFDDGADAPAQGAVGTDAVQGQEASGSGRALLGAMADVDAGLDSDLGRAARGLAALSALGHEATARQAAVELMLLPTLPAARQ